ncbi:MAG: DinB family protein [Stellaceae bacterium]
MPGRLAELVASIPPARWRTRPASGGFSLQEHACHLRDIEVEGYRARLERMLVEAKPDLPDIDGAALARQRDYLRQDLRRAQAVFAAVRADVVHRLSNLSPEQRARTGALEGVGEITVRGVVEAMLRHDAEHLEELSELRKALVA